MKLPPELEFHEDIHLLIYRPHGVIDEAAVKKVVSVLEDLEARLEKPFNRFSDTLAADEVGSTSNMSFNSPSVVACRTRGIHR